MRKFFYNYEKKMRSKPVLWYPNYLILRFVQREIINFSKLINKKNNGSVLDFGCGKAPYKSYFKSYVGADIDSNEKETDFTISAFTNVIEEVEKESIENVISIQVIEHVPDLGLYIKEALRILKQGGFFLVVAPFMYNFHGTDDYVRYSKNFFEKNSLFNDFEITYLNSESNDFIEFIFFNINHFISLFPLCKFLYPIFFINNILALMLSWICRSTFKVISILYPNALTIYRSTFLLFPFQISLILRKK